MVKTPKVLVPETSISLANIKPSDVAISLFAAITHNIIVKGSSTYLLAMSFVICSMFFGWSPMGTLVTPGKSTKVKSGQVCEYTFKTIGLSIIFLLVLQTSSVNASIVSLTFTKSVNFVPFLSSKIAHGSPELIWHKRNSNGLRVTTPSPRGKKSRPTIDSNTDDLPELWVPREHIRGNFIYSFTPQSRSWSIKFINLRNFLNKTLSLSSPVSLLMF